MKIIKFLIRCSKTNVRWFQVEDEKGNRKPLPENLIKGVSKIKLNKIEKAA